MRAIIFANGIIEPDHPTHPDLLQGDLIIAADGGMRNSLLYGIQPDIVIGDLNSISDEEKKLLSGASTHFITYPQDKDQTDLELALNYAVRNGADEALLHGLLGGQLDQTIANLLLLSRDDYSSLKLIVSAPPDTAYLLKEQDELNIEAKIGDLVSLIPLSMEVYGVTTYGLHWKLNNAKLDFGSTLSISNEMKAPRISIKIDGGKLLVIHRRVGNTK